MSAPVGRISRALAGATAVLVVGLFTVQVGAGAAHAQGSGSPVHGEAYADPGVFAYGDATDQGAPTNVSLSSPAVGMAGTSDGKGYWIATADGTVYPYGDAPALGSLTSLNLYAPIVGITATPDHKGYWMVALDGGVFSFGDAGFYGSTGNMRLNQPIVGMAPTPDGKGYWLVASDGGVFSFGDAWFYGSTGSMKLNQPVVGMAPTHDGKGYWLVAADGGIFSFGDAPFYGSLGGVAIAGTVDGMAATPSGGGYWLSNANGDVYHFGDATFYGDNLAAPRTEPISGIVPTPDGGGYWLLEPDAFPVAFSHPWGANPIVSLATSQVVADPYTGSFCNPYGPCEAWCALFATWVWNHSGVPIPSYAFVGDIYQWAASHTRVLAPAARPAPGDIVLYGTGPQNVDTAVHDGIVAQMWPDGAVDTVEGDAGPAPDGAYNVILNGPYLPSDSANYNGFPIFGYAVP
ncbi:MAG TPA: hypothetical protein VFN68_07085 [Acidimicrobiales bacterium]|nr:hypothetical protein [Acidimicrobiales bacterium]